MARNRILIVDDYTSGLETVAKLLQIWGFETRTATNGREALSALKDFAPDMVLLDWYMPILGGAGFLKQIRASERWSRLPVVVFTAWDDPEERTLAKELGADEVIAKNARACSAILESIRRCLLAQPELEQEIPIR
jgi:CheY-like chemotaxis protein